jgi:hypothetical protein
MHRLPRWAAVLFALVGAAGPVGAGPSDEARRMPVGPPDAGAPSPVVPAPAAPAPLPAPAPTPPAAPPAVPGPEVTPHYAAPVAPVVSQPQAQVPAGNGSAAGQAPAKGAQNSGHRWHLFHRRPADEARQSAKPGLFKRK